MRGLSERSADGLDLIFLWFLLMFRSQETISGVTQACPSSWDLAAASGVNMIGTPLCLDSTFYMIRFDLHLKAWAYHFRTAFPRWKLRINMRRRARDTIFIVANPVDAGERLYAMILYRQLCQFIKLNPSPLMTFSIGIRDFVARAK